jgi:Ca2+-binding EF-hand superfamily protein
MKSNPSRLTVMILLLAVSLSLSAIAQSDADTEKQLLSPEIEIAIMRVMNLENRIQTLQTVPVKMTDNELARHFSGTWICFTTMRLNGQLGRGIMEIRLEQDGDELVGEGGQLKHPFDPPSTIRPIGTWSSLTPFIGQFKKAIKAGTHHMAVIERQGIGRGTWATFTAVLAGDGRTARGTLVNRGGNYGLMFMVRREFLSDFRHLLTEEGRQAEAARRLIGIEKLEAALDTASMDTARIKWWNTDKNKDGKLQYAEFPHPDWKRANRNSDDVVDWAEEVSDRVLRKLAEEGHFLAKHGNDAHKQWPSIYAWGVAHPGFEQIFHFVDWDRDGKITSAEYTAFEDQLNTYNDPSFPKTNQDGKTREDLLSRGRSGKKPKAITKRKPSADPHVVQMETAFSKEKLAKSREMWAALDKNRDNVWQYDEFPHPDWKRANRDGDDGLSWKEELADQMLRRQSRTYPKKYGSTSQNEWPSQQAWNKDRADFQQLFAFIDWDHDGVITAAEYDVFDVQIKSYSDGSWPRTNEQGETGMEVFKRLAAQPSKAPQPPKSSRPSKASQPEKAGQSRKTSWNSQEEWDRDRPTVKWIFPFIDKNNDGKIDSDEYQAIQEYKKKHADWQDRARKELGLTTPEDQ